METRGRLREGKLRQETNPSAEYGVWAWDHISHPKEKFRFAVTARKGFLHHELPGRWQYSISLHGTGDHGSPQLPF